MPRTDRSDAFLDLRETLIRCGFDPPDAMNRSLRFSDDKFTVQDLKDIGSLIMEVREKSEAENKQLEAALEAERAARRKLLARLTLIVQEAEDPGSASADLVDS
jgi:hypothetical protein